MTKQNEIKELQKKIAKLNNKNNKENLHRNGSGKDMLLVTNVTSDTIVTSNKGNNNNQSNTVTLYLYKDFCKNQGNKEYICWCLLEGPKSFFDINKELKFENKDIIKVTVNRNKDLFEIDHKEGQTKFWKLSQQGKQFIENIIKIKQNQDKLAEEKLQYKTKEEDYEELFEELLQDSKIENNLLFLDFKKLRRLDPSLCDEFVDNYEDMKFKFLVYINNSREESIEKILPINLPNDIEIDLSKVSSKHFNKLIKTQAIIEFKSDKPESVCISSKFECPACGNTISLYHTEEYKQPNRCSCGRRGGFIEVKGSQVYEDFLEIIIKNKDISSTRTRLNLEVQGNYLIEEFIKNYRLGKIIEIVGFYKPKHKIERGKKSKRGEGYLIAENIEFLDKENIDVEISTKDKKEIDKFAKDIAKNNLDNVLPLVFPSSVHSHIGQEVMSKGMILQLVAGRNIYNEEGVKIRKKLHFFIAGEPGQNKSKSLEYLKILDPRIETVNGSTLSSAGMLLGMEKYEDKTFVSGGAIARANNSIINVDEANKFEKEARGCLHDVLESQRLRYTKVGHNIDEDIDVCCNFFGNPKGDIFDTTKTIFNQIQKEINDYGKVESNFAFLSRCDLVIGIKDTSKDRKKISKTMLNRRTSKQKESNKEVLKKFFYYAKSIDPKLTEESKDLISNYSELIDTIKPFGYFLTNRLTDSLANLSECYAKLRLSKIIEKKDVQRAYNLFLDSLKSIEVNIEGLKIQNRKVYKVKKV